MKRKVPLTIAIFVLILGLNASAFALDLNRGRLYKLASGHTEYFRVLVKVSQKTITYTAVFKYDASKDCTERMLLCVPNKKGGLTPTPWVTGPKRSTADIDAAIAMKRQYRSGAHCSEEYKAALTSAGDPIWEEVSPSGTPPYTWVIKK